MPTMVMTPRTQMRLTPALLHLARMLTLPTLSLQQAIRQELIENPALEEVEGRCPFCSAVVYGLCGQCVGTGDRSAKRTADNDAEIRAVVAPTTMIDALLADLYASLPTSEHAIARVVVGSLEEHGFLHESCAELARLCNTVEERVGAVVQRLREIGPLGIATRDTRECLLAQLAALAHEGITCRFARQIIEEHLHDLGAGRDVLIARKQGVSVEEVESVRRFIQRHLWPYPAITLSPETSDRSCAVPDVFIREREGAYHVEVVESVAQYVRVNPLYYKLARQTCTLSEAEQHHVRTYLDRALMFLTNLRQRESALQMVCEAIVARQQRFLRHGIRQLVPMTRLEIAAAVGLHESTVSRTIAEKTVQLPNGKLWPLSEFFVNALPIQDVLREIVAAEQHPLTDQQLAQRLTDQGFSVARRTVAKYRQALHILPCQLRR